MTTVDFYNIFIRLCNEHNVKPSPMLESIGIQKTAATNWKKRKSNPTYANLQKIADYFGVSVEYLKGEKENPSTESGKGEEFTVYAMGDEKPVDAISVNRDAMADLTELMEVARKLPQEKIKALLNIAKLM